jgi:hypothetical protein
VADSLEVPCFRYRGKNLTAQLAIEGNGGDILIRCPVRESLYFLTPEERVRQALLWFLLAGASKASSWKEKLRFEVEQRSIDVAAFLAADPADARFFFNIPVVMVETKRIEQPVIGDVGIEEQLKTYMIRERCRDGITFNACEAMWMSLRGLWAMDNLSDLSEVEERFQRAIEAAQIRALDYKKASSLAAHGNFDSLLRLVSLVGIDSRPTLTLSVRLRGNLGSVQAFSIQMVDADNVSYRTRGVLSRNRQHLTRKDFHSLHAVTML